MRIATWAGVAAAPLVLLAVLLARPAIDAAWEKNPAHFWLVLAAAAIATALRKRGVVGDVVNVAARLQAHAPVGSVLIGDATFPQLDSSAVVEAVPPQRVKGKERPISAYVLHALRRHEP